MKKKYFICGICFFLFLLILFFVLTNSITSIDDAIYNTIFSIRNPFFDTFFRFITQFCNTIPVICLCIILLIFLKMKDKFLFGSCMVIVVLSNQILKYLMKLLRY